VHAPLLNHNVMYTAQMSELTLHCHILLWHYYIENNTSICMYVHFIEDIK